VGTGLGLFICHGIVTSLGGEITLESDLGRGTVFRVALPAAFEPTSTRQR
jgi:signal transduction histidine kinase